MFCLQDVQARQVVQTDDTDEVVNTIKVSTCQLWRRKKGASGVNTQSERGGSLHP